MAFQRSSIKEPKAILKSAIALLLIAGCLWASQWQFQRGIDRQDRNQAIESQLELATVGLKEIDRDFANFEWRTVSASGSFDSTKQILLKNRYFEGVYGYEVLTRFTADDGRSFWVDRGWVKAGKDATTAPQVTATPTGQVSITAHTAT